MKRAYLSVWGKKGIAELAYGLRAAGYELYACGSTAKILSQAEVEVNEGEAAFSPARILGVLEPDPQTAEGARAIEKLAVPRPDLIVCNLHPLAEITAQDAFTAEELPQYLDIWNTALLRAGARAWQTTTVLCDFSDYATTLSALKDFGAVPENRRRQLAVKALMYCAYYDACAAQFLAENREYLLSDELVLALKKNTELAYGENTQQRAALYTLGGTRQGGVAQSRIIHGKPLHYNHFVDLDCGWKTVCEFGATACVVIKNGVICGAACAQTTAEAFLQAYDTNRKGAQGATVVFNRRLSEKAAQLMADENFELVSAPDFENGALEILRSSKNNRLVLVPSVPGAARETELRTIAGGLLLQEKDTQNEPSQFLIPTKRKLSTEEETSLRFALAVAKHAPSCAAVVARGMRTMAVGSGQPSSQESLRSALMKSRKKHPASDPDSPLVLACDTALVAACIKEAAKAGIVCLIQPGGSAEDAACTAVCDEHHIAMALTGLRHLRH